MEIKTCIPNRILILGGHGFGDCILSLQCASFVPQTQDFELHIGISARDEVFNPLFHCFNKAINFFQLDLVYSENNKIIFDEEMRKDLIEDFCDEFYYIIPDLLYRNPFAFDYKKYKTHPQIIKTKRLLTEFYNPEKIIYFGLQTITEKYRYYHISELLRLCANLLPDYTIYFPFLDKWNETQIDNSDIDLSNLPTNVYIHENPRFEESLDWLQKSCYFVGTCNGPSHVAYQYGIPRLILDPQYSNLPWIARWKEDYSEAVDIKIPALNVANLIEMNIKEPASTLIPREQARWLSLNTLKNALLYKF